MAVTIKGFASDWSVPPGAKTGINELIDRRGDVINALSYGYDPTGATTSHTAIQSAMDAAAANGGGSVFVPDGELVLGAALKPRNNVRLFCNEGRVRVTSTFQLHAFLIDQPEHEPIPGSFTVEGFDFEGAKPDPGVYPSRDQANVDSPPLGLLSGGWFVGSVSTKPNQPLVNNLTYRNCTFKNMMQPVHYAGFSGHGVVTGCKFINTLDPSFTYMGESASLHYTQNLTLNGGDNGVSVSRMTRNVVISDNIFIGCAFFGVWVAGFIGSSEVAGPGPDRFTVSNNVIFNCGEGGICLTNGPRYGTVSGNMVDTIHRGPLDQPTLGRGYGIRVTGYPDNTDATQLAQSLNITGNTFRNIPRVGVMISGARSVRIGENLFVNIGSEFQQAPDGTVTTTPIPGTETQYNCGIASPGASSVSNLFITNNVFIDERATPLTNYGVAPNLTAYATLSGNKGTGLRNPLNEAVEAGSNAATNAPFVANAKAGSNRDYRFATAGASRWAWRATGENETGSNAGSNFQLVRYNDAGAELGSILNVNRATGVMSFVNATPIFPAGLTVGAGATLGMSTSGAYIGAAASKIGFFGGTPTAKPSLTYSKAGETAAEAQLRGALVALGLATDNTTA